MKDFLFNKITCDITAIQYVDFYKSVVTEATLESFLVEKCTTDNQCELKETDSEQPSSRIPTVIFIKKKIFNTYKQCRTTYFFGRNV